MISGRPAPALFPALARNRLWRGALAFRGFDRAQVDLWEHWPRAQRPPGEEGWLHWRDTADGPRPAGDVLPPAGLNARRTDQ